MATLPTNLRGIVIITPRAFRRASAIEIKQARSQARRRPCRSVRLCASVVSRVDPNDRGAALDEEVLLAIGRSSIVRVGVAVFRVAVPCSSQRRRCDVGAGDVATRSGVSSVARGGRTGAWPCCPPRRGDRRRRAEPDTAVRMACPCALGSTHARLQVSARGLRRLPCQRCDTGRHAARLAERDGGRLAEPVRRCRLRSWAPRFLT